MFLGSSCIYPKLKPQPLKEEYLLSDSLEPTNEPYAIAKISELNYVSFIDNNMDVTLFPACPTNFFGPKDNYHLENSHLIPTFKKVPQAKNENIPSVEIWGDGSPYREFLHVDDFAIVCF